MADVPSALRRWQPLVGAVPGAVAAALWTAVDSGRPPWRPRRRRWDGALLVLAFFYGVVVIGTASGTDEAVRLSSGLYLLCAAPVAIGLLVAVRRPLDGWRLSLLGLVLTA